MPFWFTNLILLLFGFFTYFHFRTSVYAYCRISKMSKSYIRKNIKGALNYWLYLQLHKKEDLGVLYYFNLIYLFSLTAFSIAFLFSWVSFFTIPVIVLGVILGVATIPVYFVSLIYTNMDYVGKPFVVFRVIRGCNGKSRIYITIFDWLFCVLPLFVYVFLLIR